MISAPIDMTATKATSACRMAARGRASIAGGAHAAASTPTDAGAGKRSILVRMSTSWNKEITV